VNKDMFEMRPAGGGKFVHGIYKDVGFVQWDCLPLQLTSLISTDARMVHRQK